jgi:ABC-type transporter Mla subunit MlaD
MALINTDWSKELKQVTDAFTPVINDSIDRAGDQLSQVVSQAGAEINDNIRLLSRELHDQRRMTTEDIQRLIDYAVGVIDTTVDRRMATLKKQVLVTAFALGGLVIGGFWLIHVISRFY